MWSAVKDSIRVDSSSWLQKVNALVAKAVEGLKDGSLVEVVEEPCIHLIHVRDLLKSVDPTDAYNGSDCASLSFLNTVCQGDIMEKKRTRPEAVDCTPPDFILPGNGLRSS